MWRWARAIGGLGKRILTQSADEGIDRAVVTEVLPGLAEAQQRISVVARSQQLIAEEAAAGHWSRRQGRVVVEQPRIPAPSLYSWRINGKNTR